MSALEDTRASAEATGEALDEIRACARECARSGTGGLGEDYLRIAMLERLVARLAATASPETIRAQLDPILSDTRTRDRRTRWSRQRAA